MSDLNSKSSVDPIDPVDPVDSQIAAYNARDVDGFVAQYCDDAVVEDATGCPIIRGAAALRRAYSAFFAANPTLNCRVISRMRLAAFTIDEEEIADRSGLTRAIAIYETRDGRIARLRVLR
jgi:hypothetical protein